MPRFVLLYHDCPPNYERASHWDLMLEVGDALRTWALKQLPSGWAAAHSQTTTDFPDCPAIAAENELVAEQLGDHRRDYLELEGPLSGNRGSVVRVTEGTYESDRETPDSWRIVLASSELSGTLDFTRSSPTSPQWILSWQPMR